MPRRLATAVPIYEARLAPHAVEAHAVGDLQAVPLGVGLELARAAASAELRAPRVALSTVRAQRPMPVPRERAALLQVTFAPDGGFAVHWSANGEPWDVWLTGSVHPADMARDCGEAAQRQRTVAYGFDWKPVAAPASPRALARALEIARATGGDADATLKRDVTELCEALAADALGDIGDELGHREPAHALLETVRGLAARAAHGRAHGLRAAGTLP